MHRDGHRVMDYSGKHPDTIAHGQPGTTNLARRYNAWKTPYTTSKTTMVRARLNVPGVASVTGLP